MEFDTFSGIIMWEDEAQVRFSMFKGTVESCTVMDGTHIPYEYAVCDDPRKATRLFLEDRVVPSSRIGLDTYLQRAGIPYYDPTSLLRYNHGFSVSDHYWIRFEGEDIVYKDLIEWVRRSSGVPMPLHANTTAADHAACASEDAHDEWPNHI